MPDRDAWISWQKSFVDTLQKESARRGFSSSILEQQLEIEFPRANISYIAGMKRSGSHAIVNWMIENCFESHVFINNATSEIPDLITAFRADHVYAALIDRVICTFEHISLDFFSKECYWYIARDPYNWLASWIRCPQFNESEVEKDISVYIKNFKIAKRLIIYNDWFKSETYRNKLATKLNFINRDIGLDFVPAYGKGSSFDRRSYNGKGREMDVLNRWKVVIDDPYYIRLVRNHHEEFEKISKDFFEMKCPVY